MIGYNLQIDVLDSTEPGIVVKLKGELDQLTVRDLKTRLNELSAEHAAQLIFDLKDLEFMASAGLSVFAYFHELFEKNKKGQKVKIIGCPENVRRVFSLTKMDQILNVS